MNNYSFEKPFKKSIKRLLGVFLIAIFIIAFFLFCIYASEEKKEYELPPEAIGAILLGCVTLPFLIIIIYRLKQIKGIRKLILTDEIRTGKVERFQGLTENNLSLERYPLTIHVNHDKFTTYCLYSSEEAKKLMSHQVDFVMYHEHAVIVETNNTQNAVNMIKKDKTQRKNKKFREVIESREEAEENIDSVNSDFLEYVDGYNEKHKDEIKKMYTDDEVYSERDTSPVTFFEKICNTVSSGNESEHNNLFTGILSANDSEQNSLFTRITSSNSDTMKQLDDIDEDFLDFVEDFNDTLDKDDVDL